MALVAKARAEAFEGRYFDRAKKPTLTVAQAWEAYKPISKRDNDTWQSEAGRAKQLIRILAPPLASGLTVKGVDSYRTQRMGETTKRKTPPSPGTLDREVELLKRILNYAVACSSLAHQSARSGQAAAQAERAEIGRQRDRLRHTRAGGGG